MASDKSASMFWKRALLAGTCLAGASAAQAQIVTETTDFSGTLAGALSSPLPNNTTQVNGTVTAATDTNDFFAISNLLPGSPFTVSFSGATLGTIYNFGEFTSTGASAGTPAGLVLNANTATFTGVVPADGILVSQIGFSEGVPYVVNLTTTPVPEPSSLALMGLGVAAGALARARKKS